MYNPLLSPLLLAGTAPKASVNTMLVHLHGSMDAGHAGRMLAEHLSDSLNSRTLATFDSDQLLDYRSHRPWLTFEDWVFTDCKMPQIRLDLLRDDNDRELLLLHGPEPDAKWQAFLKVVQALVSLYEVKEVISLAGIPAGVPHTRSTPIHYHVSDPALVEDNKIQMRRLELPAGMNQLLCYHLGRVGVASMGAVAAVPYYLAEGDYPAASAALARAVSERSGLALPLGDLEAAASLALGHVDSVIEESGEAKELVGLLEHHFDAAQLDSAENIDDADIPTADEIGARLEAFLEQIEQNRHAEANPNLNLSKGFKTLPSAIFDHPNVSAKAKPSPGRHRKPASFDPNFISGDRAKTRREMRDKDQGEDSSDSSGKTSS